MIADHAMASQVELRYATRSGHQTTLAFVRTVDGEPQYAFYDEGTASRNWTYRRGSIPFDEIDAIHVGSTTLIDEEAAAETLAMVEEARGSATISFDPNCRPNLVKHKARYVERMAGVCRRRGHRADVGCRLRIPVWRQRLCGKARSRCSRQASSLVVVTRGIRGAQAWHGEAGAIEVQAPAVEVVDTIGAGDSFQAALLFALRAHRTDRSQFACAGECRRASPRAVVCSGLRGLHLRTRRRRSATAG